MPITDEQLDKLINAGRVKVRRAEANLWMEQGSLQTLEQLKRLAQEPESEPTELQSD